MARRTSAKVSSSPNRVANVNLGGVVIAESDRPVRADHTQFHGFLVACFTCDRGACYSDTRSHNNLYDPNAQSRTRRMYLRL